MNVIAFVTQHALFWLMVGNAVGLWLSVLLIFPELNRVAGEFTYGRWLPVHLNLQLYGWTSLPLVAWLFHLYPSGRSADAQAARSATMIWSASLAIGAISWLAGMSSGKIFLEWVGLGRVLFTLNLLFLWCALLIRFWGRRAPRPRHHLFNLLGLVALGAVVPLWFWASSPAVYPAVNPHTSGPTAASLLGSTLAVILILLIAAPALGAKRSDTRVRLLCWLVLVLEFGLFAVCGTGNATHRSWAQAAILGALLVWIPLLPLYFRSFQFPVERPDFQTAFLAWFGLLAFTGWISFLPKVLDAWKFTNALVAHSHLAMAGFVSCFNMFLLTTLPGSDAPAIFTRNSFRLWNVSTFLYVAVMWLAGTFEANDPGFTILPGISRTLLYSGRALCGAMMLGCSVAWWRQSFAAASMAKNRTELAVGIGQPSVAA